MIPNFNSQFFFRNQGYLVLQSVISKDKLQKAVNFIDNSNDWQGCGGVKYHPCNPSRPIKVYNLFEQFSVFKDIFCDEVFLKALANILGPNIAFTLGRHNCFIWNRKGDVGNETDDTQKLEFHRDTLQPATDVIAAIFALEDFTVENGGTWIIPGSHLWPGVGVPQPNGGGTWMHQHEVFHGLESCALQVQMNAGSVLIFSGNLFHAQGVNYAISTRKALIGGYFPPSEVYGVDHRKAVILKGEAIDRTHTNFY